MCVCKVFMLDCTFGCACVYVSLTFAIYIYVHFASIIFSVGGDSIVGTGVRLMNLGAAIYLPVWGIMM